MPALPKAQLIKYSQYALLTILALFVLRLGVIPAWSGVHSDFPNYYAASRLLLEGAETKKFYDDQWFNQQIHRYGIEQQGKFSPFPPVTAFLMLPLAPFEPLTAKRIWTVVNIIFLLLNIFLLRRITGWDYLLSSIFVLLTGIGLVNNFRLGQFYLVLSGMILLSFYLWQRGNKSGAGVLLAIGGALKYTPYVYFIAHLLKREKRMIFSGAAAIVGVFLIEVAVFGWGVYTNFLSAHIFPSLSGVLSGQTPFAISFQSWNSLLRNIFVFHAQFNPDPLINWRPGFLIFAIAIAALILGLAGYALYRLQIQKPPYTLRLQLGLLGITAMLLLPASATYHFVLLIFPVAALLSGFQTRKARKYRWMIVACYTLIGFITWGFMYRFAEMGIAIFLAYPRLILMTLLFGISLWLVHLEIRQQQKTMLKPVNV